MGKREIIKMALGATLLATPAAGLAQSWVPGAEITGQSVRVETNGVARIQTPGGNTVPGTWAASNGHLCLTTGAAQECWPYAQPFQAGQPLSLTSSCNSASRWTALSTNMAPPAQVGAGERGR